MLDIYEIIKETGRYFIYGTGVLGRFCCEKLCERYGDDVVIAYVETEPEDRPFDGGKAIIKPKAAKELFDEDVSIVITGRASAEIMRQNCLDVGIPEEQIIMLPNKEMQEYFKVGYSYPIMTACFWPPVNEINEDLLKKIDFYIPDKITIKVFTTNPLVIDRLGGNVDICIECDKEKIWEVADTILLWDVTEEDGLFAKYPGKVRVVDPNFWEHTDTSNYMRIYHDSFSKEERAEMINASRERFCELQSLAKECDKANVFCSGPSIEEVYDMDKTRFQKGFNIICNSMIKDKELLEMLQPKVLCFFDTNFFHSPGKYGEAFYRDLRETYKQYGFYLIVHDIQYPLLLKHCPEMKDKIIGVPAKGRKEYWFLSEEDFSIKSLANIMTEIMIPLASSVSDKVCIAGCTGRGGEMNYFWKHNDRTQYNDLKPSVMETWPAFFKYRRYDAYYDRHCQTVDEQLRYGESIGKKYTNITTSFIPALKDRS